MSALQISTAPIATVLLVNDQPIVSEAVRRSLERRPEMQLHVCTDGHKAIETACRIDPTVILQDLALRGVDGLDLVRDYRAHAETANVPIVVLSSQDRPAVKNAAFLAGANDYLLKLPDPVELIARIQYQSTSYLNRRQRDDALDFLTHDMRSPQAAILSLLDMYRMEHGVLPPLLERIATHATTALKLAEGFAHLARAQSDAHRFEMTNLNELLVVAADQMWEKSMARGCNITIDAPAQPVMYQADYLLLVRLVLNLIDNALKYGPPRSEVRCILAQTQKGILIGVEDAGTGIPDAEADRAVERFARLGCGLAGHTDGFGLGLSFVDVVAHKHCGRVIMKHTRHGFMIGAFFPQRRKRCFALRTATIAC